MRPQRPVDLGPDVRHATYQDLPECARVLAAAYKSDPLIGVIMHPHRERYDYDMELFFLRLLRKNFYAGTNHIHLVTLGSIDDLRPSIVRYAYWIRGPWRAPHQKLKQKVMHKVMKARNKFDDHFNRNRALDPSKADLLNQIPALVVKRISKSGRRSMYLSLLGVHPDAQRRGYGRALVWKGIHMAHGHAMGVVTVASARSWRLFRRVGLEVMLGRIGDVQVPDNPFVDMPGGFIMAKDYP